ncbi:MAG: hypothetical protein IIB38_04600 [Candidatus Hydrogenedentes bacterium]|nr:hypothetical protein [Candidatus Hydrogenedentota bacterium]
MYPADIKHWVDLTDDGSGDGDEASQIVESKEECAALFDEYNANRALNNNAGFPRALAFTVVSEEINDLDTLVCRLQDRLVVDLDDDGRIKEDSKSQVGRRFCADYDGGGSDEDSYLNCPAFQLESESDAGIQVPLCAWDVQDETCVEFTPVHHSLAPDDEVLDEVQGVPASTSECNEDDVDNPILCPEGTVATGYEGTEGTWMDKIRLICAAYRSNGTLGSNVYHSEYLGDDYALNVFNRYCREQHALVGTKETKYGVFMGSMGEGGCQPIQNIREKTQNDMDYEVLSPTMGGTGGSYVSGASFCPPGTAVTGMTGSTRSNNDVFDPCRYYYHCRELEGETTMGSIWDVDYPYPEWEL